MIFSILVILIIVCYVLDRRERYVTVFEGKESSLNEAMDYYWALKAKQIRVKYEMPYNVRNIYSFGYYESSIRIAVRKQDEEKAKEVLINFRAESRKMERNIETNTKKDAQQVLTPVK